jgi:hypothetical protein
MIDGTVGRRHAGVQISLQQAAKVKRRDVLR